MGQLVWPAVVPALEVSSAAVSADSRADPLAVPLANPGSELNYCSLAHSLSNSGLVAT